MHIPAEGFVIIRSFVFGFVGFRLQLDNRRCEPVLVLDRDIEEFLVDQHVDRLLLFGHFRDDVLLVAGCNFVVPLSCARVLVFVVERHRQGFDVALDAVVEAVRDVFDIVLDLRLGLSMRVQLDSVERSDVIVLRGLFGPILRVRLAGCRVCFRRCLFCQRFRRGLGFERGRNQILLDGSLDLVQFGFGLGLRLEFGLRFGLGLRIGFGLRFGFGLWLAVLSVCAAVSGCV